MNTQSPVDRYDLIDCEEDEIFRAQLAAQEHEGYDPLISLFPNVLKPDLVAYVSLSSAIARMKSPELAEVTARITADYRAAGGGKPGKLAIDSAKKDLPSVALQGEFNYRNIAGWRVPSDLVQIDLDGLTSEQLVVARDSLSSCPSIAALWVSPSGAGLKAAVRVAPFNGPNDAAYKVAWHGVTAWLASMGYENDRSTKDCSRLAFIAHDPDAYFNKHAVPMDLAPWSVPIAPTVQSLLPECVPNRNKSAPDAIDRARRYVAAMPPAIAWQGGHPALYAVATVLSHGFEFDEGTAFELLNEFNARCVPAWSEKELRHKLNEAITKPHDKPRGWLLNAKPEHDKRISHKDHTVSDNESNPDAVPLVVGEPWPDLIRLEGAGVPTIDPALIPGPLGAMCAEVSRAIEVPPELPIGVGLAVCSSVVMRYWHVEMKPGYKEPLTLWSAACEQSGGRKTGTSEAMTEPLKSFEIRESEQIAPEIRRGQAEITVARERVKHLTLQAAKCDSVSQVRMISEEIADLTSIIDNPPSAPRYFVQDVTVEHLAVMMAKNNECMCLLSDEAGLFNDMAGRYSDRATNIDVYLQGHAGAVVRVDRGSRPPVVMNRPRLAVSVMPQPSMVAKLQANESFRGRGLLARFIWLMPKSRVGFRTFDVDPLSRFIADEYRDCIQRILHRPAVDETVAISPDADALALWMTFVKENERRLRPEGDLAHMTDWASKASGLVARIAGVFHALNTERPESVLISLDTMSRSVALVRLFTEHAKAAFASMRADVAVDAAQRILACLPQFSDDRGIVSARDINRAMAGSFPSAADIEPGWSTLVERGYVRRVKEVTKNPGRPAIRYEINPAVASGEFCQYSQSVVEADLDNYYIYDSKSNLSLNRIDNIDNIRSGRDSA